MRVGLTRGKFVEIDDADASTVLQYEWRAVPAYNTWYAATSIKGKTVYMHRLLFGEDADKVDHRDGNGLNNRRYNLRDSTHSQNLFNRGPQKSNTSGFKGVCFDKSRGKWMANITVNGKQRNLGRFATAVEAAVAYDKAAVEAAGEFAFTNLEGRG